MNKFFKTTAAFAFGAALSMGFVSCSDDDTSTDPGTQSNTEIQAIAQQYLNATLYPTYQMLADSTEMLEAKLRAIRDDAKEGKAITQAQIDEVCTVFLHARANYETSEAFLFGAATDFGIDPHIDTWPLDLDGLKVAMNNPSTMTTLEAANGDEAANYLQPVLLGFHGIEYILFRDGHNRTAEDFNAPDEGLNNMDAYKELVYATAIAGDLRNKCFQMEAAWNPNAKASHVQKVEDLEWAYLLTNGLTYGENMLSAGQAGSTYNSWKKVTDAILIAGCKNICDEVGNVKMGTPYGIDGQEKDVNYIESPYSENSLTDFTDNIISIENSVMGGRSDRRDETKSIYAYVNSRNPELAAQLKTDIDNAKAKIQAIPHPFVENYDKDEVLTAIKACNKLSATLEEVNTFILNN